MARTDGAGTGGARSGGAYVVRDDGGPSTGTQPGNVDKLYPYTLRGLTDAL